MPGATAAFRTTTGLDLSQRVGRQQARKIGCGFALVYFSPCPGNLLQLTGISCGQAATIVNCVVDQRSVIDILSKFRYVDKYASFHEVLPAVLVAPVEQRQVVTEIVDRCCTELLFSFQNQDQPSVKLLRQSLIECMDALAIAPISAAHRDFGYQLGWYLAEKVQVDLRKGTERKLWGYWRIEGNEVKPPLRPRIAAKVKERQAPKSKKKKAAQTGAELI